MMKILTHVDGFKYTCMCGGIVDIGRHLTEDEQEWSVCKGCSDELLDMMLDDKCMSAMGKMVTPVKELVLPKLGQ